MALTFQPSRLLKTEMKTRQKRQPWIKQRFQQRLKAMEALRWWKMVRSYCCISQRAEGHTSGGGDTNLEFVNNPEGEMGAEDETAPVDSELVADAGTLEFDSLVLPHERTSGGKSHLEFAETGSQVDDAATELLLVSRDAVRCASCSIP